MWRLRMIYLFYYNGERIIKEENKATKIQNIEIRNDEQITKT